MQGNGRIQVRANKGGQAMENTVYVALSRQMILRRQMDQFRPVIREMKLE